MLCLFTGFWGPTLILKYENTAQLLINSKGMRSISQKMRVGTPIAPLPHMIWRPQAASYCAMTAYSGQIAK